MRCEDFMLKLLTLCVAWTFSFAQHNPWDQKVDTAAAVVPPSSDDDFDPQDFEEAQNYLAKYWYFHGPKPLRLKAPVDMKLAIEEFQDFVEMEKTGKLDNATMAKMRSPRCGVADFVGHRKDSHLVRRRRRYALAGQKWPKKALTYRIMNYTPDLPKDTVRTAIIESLKAWSDVAPLTFREITNGKADIAIQFARGEHGDGYPFDGRGGTLAHAYFPGNGIGGDAHFDDHEYFSHNSYKGTNLFLVAAHELGHSLGLAHSSNSRALMAPYYQGYQPNFKLSADDIKGIQRLYGKAPAKPPTGPNPRPPQEPTGPVNPRPPTGPGTGTCGGPFQAAMNFNGRIFLFQGSQYWRLEDNLNPSRGYPKPVNFYWRGAPSNVDATMVMPQTNNVVFFKGKMWYEYQARDRIRTGPLTQLGLPADTPRIDAAVIWEGNNKPYFFIGADYYRFNEVTGKIDAGYPRSIVDNWVNIPGNVGATFGSRGFTYFIHGRSYYKFNNDIIRREGDARDFGNDIMRCNALRRFSHSAACKSVNVQLATVLFPTMLTILLSLLRF